MPAGRSGYSSGYFNPTQILGSVGDIRPQASLGEIQPWQGKTYQYVQFNNTVGGVLPVAGQCCYWLDLQNFVVTSQKSSSAAGPTELCLVAGIFQYAMTNLYYGWIQCGGYATNVLLSGAGAIGQLCIPSVTDGQLTTVAYSALTASQAGAQKVAIQLAAAVANLATVKLVVKEA